MALGRAIRKAEERETTQGGSLFTKVSGFRRWHQLFHRLQQLQDQTADFQRESVIVLSVS